MISLDERRRNRVPWLRYANDATVWLHCLRAALWPPVLTVLRGRPWQDTQ